MKDKPTRDYNSIPTEERIRQATNCRAYIRLLADRYIGEGYDVNQARDAVMEFCEMVGADTTLAKQIYNERVREIMPQPLI